MSARIPNATPTARRTPFACTWCPFATLTVAIRYTRECTVIVFQLAQIRSLLKHQHIRKTKVIVSVITSYIPNTQTNKQTNTVHWVLLNYWCIFAASSRAHRSLCSPVLSCDCGVLNFALASSRSIHRFSSDERSRTDRNGRTCPLTTGQFRDGHHIFFLICHSSH